jgi:hypothetical protein
VVASKPSQSPNEEKAIAFQSFLKAGIESTPRDCCWLGVERFGIDCAIEFEVYRQGK